MGINFIRTNPYVMRIGTTRVLSISTAGATAIIMASGNQGLSLCNVGVSTLAWGDSTILAASGGLLYYSMVKEWYVVADTFTVYLRADSVTGTVVVTEYA